MTIRFEPLAASHIDQALALALAGYVHERERVPALIWDGAPRALHRAIADLVRDSTGVAALDGDRLMGYLALIGPIEGFWNSGIGCFAPLHGMAVSGDSRARLTSLLFQHAAERIVRGRLVEILELLRDGEPDQYQRDQLVEERQEAEDADDDDDVTDLLAELEAFHGRRALDI